MSDSLRQSNTDKAASALKPDSQKSTTEQLGDKAKGAGDSVAGKAQPEEEKSATQKATDSVSSAGESVKDTLGLGDKKQ
ncbi:hypothetical protein CB0940_00242 [Cercospora beticola]|uniref:Uncharacterized protein n=1 Tax=Cercospora beticola TaxID=122368 RepID=A0A2G5I8C2_CERBT|nr:hypothetical protein CB0940_00242 [Cercospora beticola]PIB01057.1 hypothetical protein CB0940_00242 [Cercospora beticola]WPA95650.1 hypothetical protein RHO25_000253 [Cercospora beticola]CAK1356112.1 unnamed protein product [Cercospora beticola]